MTSFKRQWIEKMSLCESSDNARCTICNVVERSYFEAQLLGLHDFICGRCLTIKERYLNQVYDYQSVHIEELDSD